MFTLILIISSLIIFCIIIWTLIITCPIKENWVDYKELPYGNIRSGAGNTNDIRPLVFYNYPIYRRPLNWPVCHLVDYPVPHCRSNSL
jgi:hypothetical protein